MSWGKGMTQDDMMAKDECILVNEADEIVGHASKKESHIFSKENPRGRAHRAFSVFLFDQKGRLLLQKRAADKITFPNVWTNTCCSHPLYGFEPSEVDSPEDVANGSVPGVKNAAIRKLEHELGIGAKVFKHSDFKFLTRLHYWAADVVTHGPKSPWGEHEVDYILFAQKRVMVEANEEEVSESRYVTQEELRAMMDPSSGLLWSPWFRIIAEQFLPHWWADLKSTLTTEKHVDLIRIHRFDPTTEHMGGGGGAGAWLGAATSPYTKVGDAPKQGNAALKQGSYGKVKIHKRSKFEQFSRVDEVFAALWLTAGAKLRNNIQLKDEPTRFCDDMLNKVSRSFAAVIHQLPNGLCLDILVFYLALRALDTIEDDMDAFKGKNHVKVNHLRTFYKVGLVTDGWKMENVGLGDEKTLLENYFKCVHVYKALSPASQEVIADITRRMGEGMANYVEKDLGQGTVDIEAYNLYCHYVAGLVGEGLSRLFVCTCYEEPAVEAVCKTLANTMGLMLQKTNIIRDYLEDYVDGRTFWPQEVWKQYTTGDDLGELAQPHARDRALACLNHMITDALTCAPESLQYMSLLRTEEVFRFCAIPQVMAIATLADLYNNPDVFTGVVKIRKGMAAQLILDTKSTGGLHKWFNILSRRILAMVPPNDPSAAKTKKILREIIATTDKEARIAILGAYAQAFTVLAVAGIMISAYYLFAVEVLSQTGKFELGWALFSIFDPASGTTQGQTVALAVLIGCATHVFGYSVVAAGRKGLKKAE
ncbi:isopentenyl-diphosphate delta-isomerase type 1 fused to squalene synthase [Ochromonadaceae sp. CCMP2298]|nr:isopentenyl-diphosphate delta-isomerase type 1 fused to squalene synthase [Ochromonadaceae sp. CCMP2298]|eukprot:CAMPEP_0173185850 /NCGR_PEP_ID=MMETSP1141-20130122/9792_1 /TAXON_ID=483371 /ORGANISM="non described non described, Strain CCMP2298" /LENGTH=762 /DNA_ID=CAMNT_0014109441 /DNA_START=32 /DNA_END=2320 /DNA_ORIENTATION=-